MGGQGPVVPPKIMKGVLPPKNTSSISMQYSYTHEDCVVVGGKVVSLTISLCSLTVIYAHVTLSALVPVHLYVYACGVFDHADSANLDSDCTRTLHCVHVVCLITRTVLI